MEQSNAGKWTMVSVLFFAVILMVATYFTLIFLGWACGNLLFCSVFQKTSYAIMTLHGIVMVFAFAEIIGANNISRAGLRKFFIFYVMVLLSLTLIAVLFQKGWILNTAVKGTVTECIILDDPSCYENLAYQMNDINYCKKSSPSSRCYAFFYEKTNDLSVCPGGNIQCSLSIAKKSKNPQMCEVMDEYFRERCYAGLAESTGDFSYCQKSRVALSPCDIFLGSGDRDFAMRFLTLTRNHIVSKLEKNALLAKIQLASRGGEIQLNSLSFVVINVSEEMKDVVTNLKMHIGDQVEVIADAHTTYLPDTKSLQIDFRFDEKGAVTSIPGGKTLELSITGDVGNYSREIRWDFKKYSVYDHHKLSEILVTVSPNSTAIFIH